MDFRIKFRVPTHFEINFINAEIMDRFIVNQKSEPFTFLPVTDCPYNNLEAILPCPNK